MGETTESPSWGSLVSSLWGVAGRAGNALVKVVDREGGLKESLGGNITQVVKDRFKQVFQILPDIKENITSVYEYIPEVRTQLRDKVSELPAKSDLHQKARDLLSNLPDYKPVNYLRSSVLGTLQYGLDNLPSSQYIVDGISPLMDLGNRVEGGGDMPRDVIFSASPQDW